MDSSRSQKMPTWIIILVQLLCFVTIFSSDLLAHKAHKHTPKTVPTRVESVRNLTIPKAQLLNEKGEVVFFQELIKNKTVAINTIYTNCTTICSPMGAIFGKLQETMGEHSDYQLISISIDPILDTPERLTEWSDQFNRGDRWTLVTGTKSEVDNLLKQLKIFTPDKEDHSPLMLIGNEHHREWNRASALIPPEKIATMLKDLIVPKT